MIGDLSLQAHGSFLRFGSRTTRAFGCPGVVCRGRSWISYQGASGFVVLQSLGCATCRDKTRGRTRWPAPRDGVRKGFSPRPLHFQVLIKTSSQQAVRFGRVLQKGYKDVSFFLRNFSHAAQVTSQLSFASSSAAPSSAPSLSSNPISFYDWVVPQNQEHASTASVSQDG